MCFMRENGIGKMYGIKSNSIQWQDKSIERIMYIGNFKIEHIVLLGNKY